MTKEKSTRETESIVGSMTEGTTEGMADDVESISDQLQGIKQFKSKGVVGLKGYDARLCKLIHSFVNETMVEVFCPTYKTKEQIDTETSDILKDSSLNKYEVWFIFFSKGSILGTIGIKRYDDRTVKIKRFYVSKEHRHKGIGTELIETAINYIISVTAYKKISLSVGSELNDAISLYHSKGFKDIGSEKKGNETVLKMELQLQ